MALAHAVAARPTRGHRPTSYLPFMHHHNAVCQACSLRFMPSLLPAFHASPGSIGN